MKRYEGAKFSYPSLTGGKKKGWADSETGRAERAFLRNTLLARESGNRRKTSPLNPTGGTRLSASLLSPPSLFFFFFSSRCFLSYACRHGRTGHGRARTYWCCTDRVAPATGGTGADGDGGDGLATPHRTRRCRSRRRRSCGRPLAS